jgi:hypothetical protein
LSLTFGQPFHLSCPKDEKDGDNHHHEIGVGNQIWLLPTDGLGDNLIRKNLGQRMQPRIVRVCTAAAMSSLPVRVVRGFMSIFSRESKIETNSSENKNRNEKQKTVFFHCYDIKYLWWFCY